jgi:ribosome-associated protein
LSLELALTAARAASAKTLEETVVLDVGDLIAITEYFVVTSGRNERQVRSIVDEVDRQCKAAGSGPARQVEGLTEGRWVLMDFGDVVIHVFDSEAREFYGLERLWSDADRVGVDTELTVRGATN